MSIGRRRGRNLVASRRRVADDGDDDDASADFESQSDFSAITGLNDEPASRTAATQPAVADTKPDSQTVKDVNGAFPLENNVVQDQAVSAQFEVGRDTDAMLNGLEIPAGYHDEDIIGFDDDEMEEYIPPAAPAAAPEPAQDTAAPAADPRPAQDMLIKEPELAPVPVTAPAPKHAPQQPSVPSKGHAPRQSVASKNKTPARWSHDLHETVREPPPAIKLPPKPTAAAAQCKGPSLSTTLVLGLVTMRVSLPGMKEPIVYEKMPVKHHVRLPDLRPPLRRDKPVRIAIQDNPPRYIFPSVERSFIFIPRAQRPNQQNNRYKNRPYISHFSSRRGSVYGGSNHGMNGTMSPRSNGGRDGILSPSGSYVSRPPAGAPTGPAGRPVVRLPGGGRPSSNASGPTSSMPFGMNPYAQPGFQYGTTLRENRDVSLPMHQPRPQKTVSLEGLVGPEQLQAPRQQEQQPFHHQVPGSDQDQQSQFGATPSSMLPEQVVNAQPFQPGAGYFYPTYAMPPPMVYYPPPMSSQGYAMAPMPMYGGPNPYMMAPMTAPGGNDDGGYSQESNGTTYFYAGAPTGGEQGGAHQESGEYGAQGIMKPEAAEFFYQANPMMYYPTQ